MRAFTNVLCFGLTALASSAHAAEYKQILTDKSQLGFVSKQMGVPVDGSFRQFSARIAFDPAKPQAGSAQVDITLASIDTGSAEANDEVKSKNWFNVAAWPTARFAASSFRSLGGNRFEALGKLSLKGRTKDVILPFTLTAQGANAVVDGAFVLKRTDYGLGEGPWGDVSVVADEVQVRFHLLAAGKK